MGSLDDSSPTDTQTASTQIEQLSPPARRPLAIYLVIAALAIAALASGITYWAARHNGDSGAALTAEIKVTGSLMLYHFSLAGDPCDTSGTGYTDIHAGTSVTVTDAAGKMLAVSALERGYARGLEGCTYPFTLAVPAGLGPYAVEVSHRGRVPFTEAQLSGPVDLTLGQ